MKEKLVTVSQLAELLNIKSQGIYSKIKSGQIIRRNDGYIDILEPVNLTYLKERGVNAKTVKIPSEGKPGKPITPREPGQIKTANNKSRSELNEENLILKNEKLRLEIARKNKELLPTQLVEDLYITYLERFNTTVERLAGTYIRDIGKDILEAGEVQPIHITRFINNVLEITHNNKQTVQKLFTQYTPE